ncbi:MAG: helix-turn-helix domain-containing protein [Oscillospiraceae bacterium]|nr:helix-turn-helix domain-containing protein [Oscillospiraceae bacterium]
MRILIFDDDKSTVDMLLKTINWELLGIDKFLTAYTVKQAKAAFLEGERIDLMLCDIEAPGENGIDLLRWVRQNGYETENIFLTNHAEFSFAQEAVRLGSVEYILKLSPPEQVEQALRRAANRINSRESLQDDSRRIRKAERMEKWLDFLIGHCGAEELKEALRKDNPAFDAEQAFLLALCHFPKQLALSKKEREVYLGNAVREIVLYGDEGYAVFSRDVQDKVWIMMPPSLHVQAEALLGQLLAYFERTAPKSGVSAYYSDPAKLEALPGIRRRLEKMAAENVTRIGEVLRWRAKEEGSPPAPAGLPPEWTDLLKNGRSAELFGQIKAYLEQCRQSGSLDRTMLQAFHLNYMQMVYSALHQEQIEGNRLFCDGAARQLYASAELSIYEMMKWVGFSLNRTCDVIREARRAKTVIDEVREYIDGHFCEKLRRKDIAARFYMNEDHLSHLFKKRFSATIPEYINCRRVEYASTLLRRGYSVQEVSMACGFETSSYFSTVFRRLTGRSPSDYRKSPPEK